MIAQCVGAILGSCILHIFLYHSKDIRGAAGLGATNITPGVSPVQVGCALCPGILIIRQLARAIGVVVGRHSVGQLATTLVAIIAKLSQAQATSYS